MNRARDHGRGAPRRPRRQEEAALQLLPGRDIRSAGQPAARRAREAPLQGRRAERALDNGRHGIPHPRGKDLPLPDNRLPRRHADKLDDLRVPGRGDGELVASGRMRPAQGGRAPKGTQRPRLPLPLARVDKDMRRARHREVDVEKGLQPGQRARRGLLRKA